MAHQQCRKITRWVDPVLRQVEECIIQDCNPWCLCCNKWLCGFVWVIVTAGRWITETVCEAITTIADVVVDTVGTAFNAITKFLGEVVNFVIQNPELINKAAGLHILRSSAPEGGWFPDPPNEPNRSNSEKRRAEAFNNAMDPDELLGGADWYNDSGKRCAYTIDDDGNVWVSIDDAAPILVQHTQDQESVGMPTDIMPQNNKLPAGTGIHFTNLRKGELVGPLRFDMIAASGNRVFAREAHSANFYFASIHHEFLNRGPETLGAIVRGATVPGVYATLDAESGKRVFDYAPNPATESKYKNHPSLKMFAMMEGAGQVVATRAYEGMMVAKVFPRLWHRLDTRPPVNSKPLPWYVEGFYHVVYDSLLGETRYQSIRIYDVLDLGVGHTHRVLHQEAKYGDEVDTMGPLLYPALAGPIQDGGGFCDGMCNFYVLCKIKVSSSFDPISRPRPSKISYAILWIDEQTYYCERWRIVGFKDGGWNDLRAWGISGVYSSFNADSPKYWNPFETSWWWDEDHFEDSSRLGVAKHTLVVTGRARIGTLHPDNHHESVSAPNKGKQNFHPVLFTANFSFATSDKSWRWRGYPCRTEAGVDWMDTTGPICYPETMRIREDMTICLKGVKDGVRGYWYQKYLPADNEPVPDEAHLGWVSMPSCGYMHGWNFINQRAFSLADKFSNFGVHAQVDSRSQYYLLDLRNELPPNFEEIPWKDSEARLSWNYPGYGSEPSPYNKGSFFKILYRPQEGFIAVWWDKRDDEIPEVNYSLGEVSLMPMNGNLTALGPSVKTGRFDRRRKLSPPVVQFAKVSLEVADGVVEAFIVRFYTRMRVSGLTMPTPIEWNDGQWGAFMAQDNDIKDYIERHTPDYVRHDELVGLPFFKPDTTIFRVHITAVARNGGVVNILEERVEEPRFKRVSRFEFLYEWRRPSHGQRHPQEALLLQYCEPAAASDHGTSVWFEDITGHVATAERTLFT